MSDHSGPDHDVVIVGAGLAGLCMAIRLDQEGHRNLLVLERGDHVGGTWRDNHYPGCACDVPAPLYSLSFAPNPEWSRLFAPHDEIRAYTERCVDEFGIRDRIRTGAELTDAHWDEERQLWHVEINGGETVTARVLVPALGGLSRPAFPDLEGIERFQGRAFHSAQWEEDFDFAGKRVAVVGTGASAIQLVPQVAKAAAQVHLFQRTPPWVMPKPDRRIGRRERALYRRFPLAQKLLRAIIYASQEIVAVGTTRQPKVMIPAEAIGRRHIRRHVKDPELVAKLTPDYRLGCKRILVSNDYYPALARDNVDVLTCGIERVTETGVVTRDGQELEVDAIIFGTGFRATDLMTPLSIRGRDGRDINDAWAERMEAHLGTTVAGFPNAFLLVGPNTGTGHNSQLYMIECQVHYVVEALAAMRREGLASVEVRAEAQAASNADVRKRLKRTVWARGGCNSWYLDAQRAQRDALARLHLRVPSGDTHVPARPVPDAAARGARAGGREDHDSSGGVTMARKATYDIQGRTVLITGAARGIGAETARRLHAGGMNVALVGLEPERLEALSEELGSDRSAVFEADVTDLGALEKAVAGTVRRFGGVDVSIANAGLHYVGALATAPIEQVEREIDVNLYGVLRTDRAVLPQIIERKGYILNIASLAAAAHAPLMAPYAASKAGVEGLTNALRLELAPTGARAGCAYFGFIDTDLVRASMAHPSTKSMEALMPSFIRKAIPVSQAVDAIEGGVRNRKSRVWAPRYVGGALALRGIFQPLSEWQAIRSGKIADAVALADPGTGTLSNSPLGVSADVLPEERERVA